MNANQKHAVLVACIFSILSGVVMVVETAEAGLYLPEPVEVDLTNRSAVGDMWSARYGDPSESFIGCGVVSVQGGAQFAFCQARDVQGDFIFCAINDPDLIESVKAITSDAVLRFQWNENDECTVVNVSTNSYSIRRRPGG